MRWFCHSPLQATKSDIFSEDDAVIDSDDEVIGGGATVGASKVDEPAADVESSSGAGAGADVTTDEKGEETVFKNALCENLIKKGSSGYYYAHMRALEESTPAVVYDGTVGTRRVTVSGFFRPRVPSSRARSAWRLFCHSCRVP